jgi:hypothetical protein
MNHRISNIVVKAITLTFFFLGLTMGFPVTDIPKNVLVVKAEARGPGGRHVGPRPADRRAARRVHRQHHRNQTNAYVYSLPSDCQEEVVSGETYYYCDGVYYQAYYQGNDLVYVEVEPPQ